MDPMSQAQVEEDILRLNARLEQVTEDFAVAAREAASADVTYRLAYGKALLTLAGSKMSVPLKEAAALRNSETEFMAAKLADAELKALQETSRNLRSQLDSLRSINANVRAVATHS